MGGGLRIRAVVAVVFAGAGAGLVGLAGVALGRVALAARSVRYHGLVVRIPRSWPVVDLSRDPHACVRFDHHALYLGTPGAEEHCPAHAVGRTEAILIAPLTGSAGARSASAHALGLGGHTTSFGVQSAGVEVTVTWSRAPGLVARALGRASLPGGTGASATATGRQRAAKAVSRGATAAGSSPSTIYEGLGFDTCSAPASSQMSKWSSSPYRAVGIYIGGVNSACAQPNLNSSWVDGEIAAGWHLIPLYVGLQAPQNGCGCAAMSTTTSVAATQGQAAASDAVMQARRLGITAGDPIFDDMEGYATGGANTPAVLAFLSGWTSELHADGYLSGVYSSAASGISDLVGKYGTSYSEPDDISIADWNGQKTTSDPYVPSGDWANHQRLHQYSGGHNETYGGVTLNIDGDYLDGATAYTGDGYLILTSNGGVSPFGSAVSYGSDAGKLPAGVTAVALAVDPVTGGYWILRSDGGVDYFNAPADGSLHGELDGLVPVALAAPPKGGYLILTSNGGVSPFGSAVSYGSDAGKLPTGVKAVALAVDRATGGYWILRSDGGVDHFNAPADGSLYGKLNGLVPVALAAPPKGGYLILTSNGGVRHFGPATSYGSDAGELPKGVSSVALASDTRYDGYRLLRSDGGVDSFDASWDGSLQDTLPTGWAAVGIASGG